MNIFSRKREIMSIENILSRIETILEYDKLRVREDMDILSRRITNAFDYIGDLRSEYKAHETRFHTPKKPAEKKKGKK